MLLTSSTLRASPVQKLQQPTGLSSPKGIHLVPTRPFKVLPNVAMRSRIRWGDPELRHPLLGTALANWEAVVVIGMPAGLVVECITRDPFRWPHVVGKLWSCSCSNRGSALACIRAQPSDNCFPCVTVTTLRTCQETTGRSSPSTSLMWSTRRSRSKVGTLQNITGNSQALSRHGAKWGTSTAVHARSANHQVAACACQGCACCIRMPSSAAYCRPL